MYEACSVERAREQVDVHDMLRRLVRVTGFAMLPRVAGVQLGQRVGRVARPPGARQVLDGRLTQEPSVSEGATSPHGFEERGGVELPVACEGSRVQEWHDEICLRRDRELRVRV